MTTPVKPTQSQWRSSLFGERIITFLGGLIDVVEDSLEAQMLRKIYIETTIPSFYHETRTAPEIVARRSWTREWWDTRRNEFELVTSAATLKELESGEYPHQADALELIRAVLIANIDDAISEIVATYIDRKVMPDDPDGDALHLAVASYHRCDFLLTWNCRHLANANKFSHIRRVNTMLGLIVPMLVTPLQLLGKGDADARK